MRAVSSARGRYSMRSIVRGGTPPRTPRNALIASCPTRSPAASPRSVSAPGANAASSASRSLAMIARSYASNAARRSTGSPSPRSALVSDKSSRSVVTVVPPRSPGCRASARRPHVHSSGDSAGEGRESRADAAKRPGFRSCEPASRGPGWSRRRSSADSPRGRCPQLLHGGVPRGPRAGVGPIPTSGGGVRDARRRGRPDAAAHGSSVAGAPSKSASRMRACTPHTMSTTCEMSKSVAADR